jgi:hypothetical protein
MRSIVPHTRRDRVANYGDTVNVRGQGRVTAFDLQQNDGCSLAITAQVESFSIPPAALGTGDFRPSIHVEWGHGGTMAKSDFDITFRQRIPLVASTAQVQVFIASFPFPGKATAPRVPDDAKLKARVFVSDNEPLSSALRQDDAACGRRRAHGRSAASLQLAHLRGPRNAAPRRDARLRARDLLGCLEHAVCLHGVAHADLPGFRARTVRRAMPANSPGLISVIADVAASARYAFSLEDDWAAVTQIPKGGTALVLRSNPSDGDNFGFFDGDGSCSVTSPVTVSAEDGKPINRAISVLFNTPNAASRFVFSERLKGWTMLGMCPCSGKTLVPETRIAAPAEAAGAEPSEPAPAVSGPSPAAETTVPKDGEPPPVSPSPGAAKKRRG